ncbi:unnamed protein product, partial [Oncorhynchus mykiss]
AMSVLSVRLPVCPSISTSIYLSITPSLSSNQVSDDRKTYFVKIHAPWEVLATYADVLKIKVPFKENDIPVHQDIPMDWLFTPFRLPDHVMNPEPDYFTSPFNKGKIDFFLIDDKETFFPPSVRNRIVYYILARCPYHKTDREDKKGIKRLLNNGTYGSAFPLHDVRGYCPTVTRVRVNSVLNSCQFRMHTEITITIFILCFFNEKKNVELEFDFLSEMTGFEMELTPPKKL